MMTEELGKAQVRCRGRGALRAAPRPGARQGPPSQRVPRPKVLSTTVTGPYEKVIGFGLGKMLGWLVENGAFPMGPPTMHWLKDPTQTEDPAEYVTELQVPMGSARGAARVCPRA